MTLTPPRVPCLITCLIATKMYVKAPASVPVCVSGLVTVTFWAPTVPGGVTHVREVELTKTTEVAGCPPMETEAPATKLVPVTVTAVPPTLGPLVGLMPVTVGAGAGRLNVYPLVNVAFCVSVLVMTTFTAPVAWAGV